MDRVPFCRLVSLAVLALFALPLPARANRFDLIYGDQIMIRACSGCGVTLAGTDFALVVNKSAAPITAAEFFGATFNVTPLKSGFTLSPFINNPGPPVAPILQNEAVGSVSPDNTVLSSLVLPGETHRNTAPMQVLAFQFDYAPGFLQPGPYPFVVEMTMGGETVLFTMTIDRQYGATEVHFTHAARTSSSGPVETKRDTWGRIKTLYR